MVETNSGRVSVLAGVLETVIMGVREGIAVAALIMGGVSLGAGAVPLFAKKRK